MEPPFEKLAGVRFCQATPGQRASPSYKVAYENDSLEAVLVVFDPRQKSTRSYFLFSGDKLTLLKVTVSLLILAPIIEQRSLQPASNKKHKKIKSRAHIIRIKRKIVTPILEAQDFWIAEEYHQDFYKKSPDHYYRYRLVQAETSF